MEVGDYLVVWITAMTGTFIAEVVQREPLKVKVRESGTFAFMRHGDFIILVEETEKL